MTEDEKFQPSIEMAFPCPVSPYTLRDFFAAAALTGICANPDISDTGAKLGNNPLDMRRAYVVSAYETADAMLAERKK